MNLQHVSPDYPKASDVSHNLQIIIVLLLHHCCIMSASLSASLPFKKESTHIFTPTRKMHWGFRLVWGFFFSFSFYFRLIGVAKHHLVLISTLTTKIMQHQDRPSIKMNTSAVQTDQHRVPWHNVMCIPVLQMWVFVVFLGN